MSLAEQIYQHSRRLPEHVAQEALDFIEFLEQRYSITKVAPDQSDETERFFAAISPGLSEDFPDDISDDDLGIDVPRKDLD